MKLVGMISTAVLSLVLGVAAPAFATGTARAGRTESQACPGREESATGEVREARGKTRGTAGEERQAGRKKRKARRTRTAKPAEKNAAAGTAAAGNRGGRIPADKFKANFGQQHTFRVSQGDYNNHRFQYGGYSFGFVDPWPSNWLYTQNVYVIEIDGVYYLCNRDRSLA